MDCIQIEQVSFAARSIEKTASLKIYKDSFTVLAVEHQEISLSLLSVWRAYPLRMPSLLLGGDYPDKSKESTFARRMKQYHFEKQREMRQKEQAALDVKTGKWEKNRSVQGCD